MTILPKNEISPTLFDRGRAAQRKTVEGIFEFAACVIELKKSANTIQGGTDFAILCKKEWGLSQVSSKRWLGVGKNIDKLGSISTLLPASYNTLYSIGLLSDESINRAIKEKIINPSATGADITNFKNRIRWERDKIKKNQWEAKNGIDKKQNANKGKVANKEKVKKNSSNHINHDPLDQYKFKYRLPKIEFEKFDNNKNLGLLSELQTDWISEDYLYKFLCMNDKCMSKEVLMYAIKLAIQKSHPDKGGNKEMYQELIKIKEFYNER